MSQKQNDLQKIKKLIEIMKQNDLVEIEIKNADGKIFLKRSEGQVSSVPMVNVPISAPTAAAGGQAVTAGTDDNLIEIKSPIVGTFYATPSPDSDPYVEVDSHVEQQTVVCVIEAMKVMNEIKAETSGTIAEVLVNNGQAVEYGQVLFKVKPD